MWNHQNIISFFLSQKFIITLSCLFISFLPKFLIFYYFNIFIQIFFVYFLNFSCSLFCSPCMRSIDFIQIQSQNIWYECFIIHVFYSFRSKLIFQFISCSSSMSHEVNIWIICLKIIYFCISFKEFISICEWRSEIFVYLIYSFFSKSHRLSFYSWRRKYVKSVCISSISLE